MHAKLIGVLLFACQIIFNESTVIREPTNYGSAITLPEGYTRFLDVHAAYKIYEVDTTWTRARDLCKSENAHLAITDSVEKIAHIKSLPSAPSELWLHVGIYFSNTTNQWVRVDNDLPLLSIPWIKDNPEGVGDCAGVAFGDDGLVGDYECDAEGVYYVCEIAI